MSTVERKSLVEQAWERPPVDRGYLVEGWHELAIDHVEQRLFHERLLLILDGRVLRSTAAVRVGKPFKYVFDLSHKHNQAALYPFVFHTNIEAHDRLIRVVDEAVYRMQVEGSPAFDRCQDTQSDVDGVKVLASCAMTRTRGGYPFIRTTWAEALDA